MCDAENIRNIGTVYWNIEGQLTHPELVSNDEAFKDHEHKMWGGKRFEKWIEIVNPYVPYTLWIANHDLTTRNQLMTVLQVQEDEVEAIAIITMVYFPFPDVATVRVFVDGGDQDIDLLFENDGPSNLDQYSLEMHRLQEARHINIEKEIAMAEESFEREMNQWPWD